ncbi:MAG: GNAT family N-acetyltransferase, partial [Anaerolineales bacterium]|nr:GNAT family N-acetyltransferase [Anaerolineales bacterium]
PASHALLQAAGARLAARQAADGRFPNDEAHDVHTTLEALRAFRLLGAAPAPQRAPVLSRPLQATEADYWRVYQLLLDSVPLAPPGFNWDMRRWEGRRFYDANPAGSADWAENGQVWETAVGQIVALALPEGPSTAALLVHPDYRHLEAEIIAWAEAHIRGPVRDGSGLQTHFFVYDHDALRQALLAARGYEQMGYGGVIRRLRFGQQPLAQPSLAAGYALRETDPDDPADCQQIADLLNAAFGRTFHNAAEYHWFTRHAPGYRRDLDLVAVASDGRFAAYVGVPYDAANRRGVFEPVCTHPDHQQKGLGKALMREALLRLQTLGAVDVCVETGDMVPANKLYDSLGFTERHMGHYWRKLHDDENT